MSRLTVLAALVLLAPVASVYAQATIEIVPGDAPGVGFNDPTPVAPVGGNTGATLGEQRLNVFRHAAAIWGSELDSGQLIRVLAFFTPLACSDEGAALGAAAPYSHFAGFGAGRPATWYPVALAEKLANMDFGQFFPPQDRFEIYTLFNSELGQPGCLEGVTWYYGLDAATPPGTIHLAETVLHELAHGLGFTVSPTNSASGARAQGLPSIWETRLFDLSLNRLWLDMTASERQASALNTNNLVWTGPASRAAAADVLDPRPEVVILDPPALRGEVQTEPASFGAPLTTTGVTGPVMPAIDTGGESPLDACEPLDAQSAFSVAGRIALVNRGGCAFTVKAINLQSAGAIGLLVANNVPGAPPLMGGEAPGITIPVAGITQELGEALREQLRFRGRSVSPVRVTIRLNPLVRSGTTNGFPRMYAPSQFRPGSSVSHWDTSMTPDQLMEPFDSAETSLAVAPPRDLTLPLLQDIGW